MRTRIGKVTNVYPTTGKVKVMYEDEESPSLPLSMLTMNQEYSMPAVGDRVVTIHLESGSSKGFVLGTYYGGNMLPKASAGYRKDFGKDAYIVCKDGAYELSAKSVVIKARNIVLEADEITLKCSYGEIAVEELIRRMERIEDQLELSHTV
ncbi:MAG: hypothetical protein NC541_10945 [bacterium]|nr:hypothetical protein [bacterium]